MDGCTTCIFAASCARFGDCKPGEASDQAPYMAAIPGSAAEDEEAAVDGQCGWGHRTPRHTNLLDDACMLL